MALVEYLLDGTKIDKVQIAIERYRAFEPPEGYLVEFSGGKDSECILELAKMAGVKFRAEYNVTSVDPPELVQFIKDKYPEVKRNVPLDKDGKPITMWNLISRKLIPPTRICRYCCEKLKESQGKGEFIVTGVRKAESVNRAKNNGIVKILNPTKEIRQNENFLQTVKGGVVLNDDNDEARRMVEQCFRTNKTILNPIVDWTDEDVWEFIHTYSLPYCGLYDKGYKRLGCIGCPMNTTNAAAELDANPKYKQAYLRAFGKMLKEREKRGVPKIWDTPEDVMEWWLGKKPLNKELEGQISFEEGL